jgi:hypothetical protein
MLAEDLGAKGLPWRSLSMKTGHMDLKFGVEIDGLFMIS